MPQNYPCSVCGRCYERLDHLRRHLRSHENSRPFRCSECPKGFNRADLLQRHSLAHARATPANGVSALAERASHACVACVRAKTKCDETKPCNRCISKALDCKYSGIQRSRETPLRRPQACLDKDLNSRTVGGSSSQDVGRHKSSATSQPLAMHKENAIRGLDHSDETAEDLNSAVVAEHLANHGQGTAESPGFPHDVHDDILNEGLPHTSTMLSDFSLPFADLNSPAFDVGVICDMFEIDIAGYWGAQVTTDTAQPMSQANIRFRGDPSARSEAFKRSPWVHWQPAKLHHAFTGQETIDATPTDAAESPLSAQSLLSCTIHDALDERGRDQILQVVTSLKDDRFSVLSFPSLELLNNLVTAFFAQENATIATSIHQPTFSCQDTRPELLLGMIAAGAVAVSERRIQMMGLVMHEVLRLAITELFEYDNSATRDLQALQAFVSVLEIGAWSGVKRKTEIACGFIQPTATMLRQSGAFSQSFFDEPVLTPERRAEDLERRWKKWAAKESLKRLVIRAFVYDSQVAMGYFQSPVISFAQLRIPVPAPAAWWLAEDSVRWSERVPASADNVGASPLITDVLTDLTTLDKYSDQADIQLCCFVVVHALANQVGELRQHMMLAATATGPKQRGLDAWWISRQRELYEDLTIARMYCARRAPHHELGLLFEYVMMSLYVSLDDIQRYAGKDGEGEARRLTPTLTEWTQTAAARTAIWHAGQVFRIARCFPPSTLRNFYAIGVYHAALTLWVYSSLRNGGRTSDVFTPPVAPFAAFDTSASHSRNSINGASRSNDSPLILPAVKLDQEENEDVRAFLLLGLGTPGLCYFVQEGKFTWPGSSQAHGSPSLPQFRSLNSSAFPMELARDIFRNNALFADESSSFLVQNLFGLLGDLESLS